MFALWEKKVYYNRPCNSILELQWPFATLHIDAWWVLTTKLHELLQFIVYTVQLCQNNSFSINMQLRYNHTHDFMLTSLIVIHLLKYDTWHYKKLGINYILFWNIDLHCPLCLLMMIWGCDMWHNKKLPHGLLILFWTIK
jgi:hypothetical protein